MAGGMQGLHGNALADLEGFAVPRGLRDGLALLSSDDGQFAEFVQLGGYDVRDR